MILFSSLYLLLPFAVLLAMPSDAVYNHGPVRAEVTCAAGHKSSETPAACAQQKRRSLPTAPAAPSATRGSSAPRDAGGGRSARSSTTGRSRSCPFGSGGRDGVPAARPEIAIGFGFGFGPRFRGPWGRCLMKRRKVKGRSGAQTWRWRRWCFCPGSHQRARRGRGWRTCRSRNAGRHGPSASLGLLRLLRSRVSARAGRLHWRSRRSAEKFSRDVLG